MSIINVIREVTAAPVTTLRKGQKNLINGRKRNSREFQYGTDRNQRVIYYQPKEVRHNPVILYFHGGGFRIGDPAGMGVAADVFCDKGYRFFSIGYRLTDQDPFPAQVEDAFRGYVVALKILELIDQEEGREASVPPVIVGGNSAGGLLAILLAYSSELADAFGYDTSDIAGVISVAGLVDMRDGFGKYRGKLFENMSRLKDWGSLKKYSPIDILDETARARYLAIHGKHDSLSPYRKQREFVAKLNAIDERRRAAGGEEQKSWSETSDLETGRQIATLYALNSPKYQHILLSAGIFTENVKHSRPLRVMFRWLEDFDLMEPSEPHEIAPEDEAMDQETWLSRVHETTEITREEMSAAVERVAQMAAENKKMESETMLFRPSEDPPEVET